MMNGLLAWFLQNATPDEENKPRRDQYAGATPTSSLGALFFRKRKTRSPALARNKKRASSFFIRSLAWCPERESNPHGFLHSILSRTRIPVPPSGLIMAIIAYFLFCADLECVKKELLRALFGFMIFLEFMSRLLFYPQQYRFLA